MERLNPLEHLYFHASTMNTAWQGVMKHAPAQQDFGGLLAELKNERDIEFIGGLPLAHSIEAGGVLTRFRARAGAGAWRIVRDAAGISAG